jgi:hypothetical protein
MAIGGQTVFLIEDASPPGEVSDAIRHAHVHFGMSLYALGVSGWRSLIDLDDASEARQGRSRFRQEGTNFLATRSAAWLGILGEGTHR